MIEIPLSQSLVTVIDDADWDAAKMYRWCASVGSWGTYAIANIVKPDGKRTMIKLHRVVMNAQPGPLVDHRNHNGLDNRRENLRLCTTAQNGANNRPAPGRYKGVGWHSLRCKWRAYIMVDRQPRHLGLFDDPWEAAQAYNTAAHEAWGEFAYLNQYDPRIVAELLGGASVTQLRKAG